MKVPRYNFAAQVEGDLDELMSSLRNMLLNGHFELCDEVNQFESAFAAFVGVKYARGVNSGTDAITLALRALGIGPGDEVIVPANTFYATVAAIALTGATPVLVDAEEGSYLANPAQIVEATTARTRCIIPVHLFGKPMDLTSLLPFAETRGISIVEDAAQAHGASLGGRQVGSFGACGCFSFHVSKNLSAPGNGGAVVTNDPRIARSIEGQRRHGQFDQGQHEIFGINSKLDAIHARVLSAKLKRLPQWNKRRREIASLYRDRLAGLPISFQSQSDDEEHAYHLFQVRTKARDALLDHLVHAGADAVVRYPIPIHLQRTFECYGWKRGEFPVAEVLADELLCLPIRPDMSESEVAYVAESVRQFFSASS
ncbi:MAG: DegT/DnrJ/EryC1/StrS family aminotransferase [Candidatus Cybelea sp.]|jgi:dTDP-4-amino-4,6-dideoxygalactose transaminase